MPTEAVALKAELTEMLPFAPIVSLLIELDTRTGFLDCFTHAGGNQTRISEVKRNLIAVLSATPPTSDSPSPTSTPPTARRSSSRPSARPTTCSTRSSATPPTSRSPSTRPTPTVLLLHGHLLSRLPHQHQVSVAADAMRDVMEIENLMLDFAVAPEHIDEWLTADERTLRNKFSPASVRKRLHTSGEGRYAATAESLDYRAHSAALHVSPRQHPITATGFSADRGWNGDAGLWEIFEHARRLRLSIRRLTSALHPDSALNQLANQDLHDLQDAWQRTQEMQTTYLSLLQASAETHIRDGEDS